MYTAQPFGYVDIIRNAKYKQPKYEIKYLDFSFFHEFKAFPFYTLIRPVRVAGDNCVHQICQHRHSDDISYKLRHSTDEWSSLPQRLMSNVTCLRLTALIYIVHPCGLIAQKQC